MSAASPAAPFLDPYTDRGLTASGLSQLLARLGPDLERAGAAYEELRQRLIKFFDWRGAWSAEEGADETLDRLARKLEDGEAVTNVRTYAHGIARRVLLEQWRRPDVRAGRADQTHLARLPAPETDDEERLVACLNACLDELPLEGRELILEYYVAEGRAKIENRRRLAEARGLSENALRSRVQRLRDRVQLSMARRVAAARM